MKYLKLFESVDEDNIIFSLTEEDIEDLILPLTDIGFKHKIEKFHVDENFHTFSYNNFSYTLANLHNAGVDAYTNYSKNFRKKIIDNNIFGAYKISMYRDSDAHQFTKLHYINNFKDIDRYKLIINEISQISKRVHYIEWTIENNNIKIFIVCPKKNIKKDKKEFLKKKYDDLLISLIHSSMGSVIRKIKDNVTPVFKSAILSNFLPKQVLSSNEQTYKDGVLYMFVKKINRSVIKKNVDKLEYVFRWKDNKLPNQKITFKFIETFQKNNPNVDIPENTDLIVEIKFDYNALVRECKEKIKKDFIERS